MTKQRLSSLVARLESADVDQFDDAAARASLADLARIANWTVAVRSALVRRLDSLATSRVASHAADVDGSPEHASPDAAAPIPKPAELELADTARITEREAIRQATLARLLSHFPVFGAALRASKVAESHLQVLGRYWHQIDLRDRERLTGIDRLVAELASGNDPERFRRLLAAEMNRIREGDGSERMVKQRRATALTHWIDDGGMVNVHARFDPERGQRLLSRIRSRRSELIAAGEVPPECPDGDNRWEHLDAVALFDLTAGHTAGEEGSGGRPRMFAAADTEVVVVIDEQSLRTRLHEATHLDTGAADMPVETVRRLACDARIIPVVLGGKGEVLDVGRDRRLATHAQRIALRAMYSTCAVDGCSVPFDRCQPHHLDPWEPDGATDLNKLVPLCDHHHHAAHEGGWALLLEGAERRLTVTRPDGTVLISYPDGRRSPARSNAFDSEQPAA